jgi:hypothetical protein
MKTTANANPLVAAHKGKPLWRSSGSSVPVLGAVVVRATLVVPFPGTDAGLKVHVASEGKPEQAKLVVPRKPFRAICVNVTVAVAPGEIAAGVEEDGDKAKSGPNESGADVDAK